MSEYSKYNIVDTVLELNSNNPMLSDINPFDYNFRRGTCFSPDYSKYPTKYFLKEIYWDVKNNPNEIITLKIYENLGFDLKITFGNLLQILKKIEEYASWSEKYATILIEKLNNGENYIDWYNLVLEEKMRVYKPKERSYETHKKYILEDEWENFYENANNFRWVIIEEACKSGLISIFDRYHQLYSKYIIYQGIGEMFNLCGSCGISFSYRESDLCYYMQAQS